MGGLADSANRLMAQEASWDMELNPGQVMIAGQLVAGAVYESPIEWELQDTGGWVKVQRLAVTVLKTVMPTAVSLGAKISYKQADYTVNEEVPTVEGELTWTVRCVRRTKATRLP